MRERRTHSIQNVFVLALFAVFAAATLLTLLFGAEVYQSMEQKDAATYQSATAAAYLAQRLRHSAEITAVAVEHFGDGDALLLTEETAGTRYQTRIYTDSGWLCELYTEEGIALAPDAGTRLLECEGLTLTEKEAGLLQAEITGEDGNTSRLTLSLRAGRCLTR